MKCLYCNNEISDSAMNCPKCGVPVTNYNNVESHVKLTRKEFLKHPNMKKCYDNIKSSILALYICAAATLALSFISVGTISIDVIIILGFTIGIHLVQSRVCAVCIFIYSLANLLWTLYYTGRAGGLLIFTASIGAVTYTFQFQKAWKKYQQTGILPLKETDKIKGLKM